MSASVLDRHPWIGLDIGGANIKTAHEDGQARTVPFEVWKRPDELGRAIAAAAAALPASDRAAVTMTAELCDCYPTKAVGVNAVLDAVLEGIPGRSIVVWGVDGEFHSVAEARRQPHLAAAANWLALANLAARSDSGVARSLDRHRLDHDRPDPARPRTRGRAGAKRHRAPPDRRAGLCGRAPNADLRTGDRAAVARDRDRTGRRDLRLDARRVPHAGRYRSQPERSFDGRRPARHGRGGPRPPGPDGRRRPRRLFGRRTRSRSPTPPTNACSIAWHSRPSEPRGRRSAAPPPRSSPARASSWPGGWPGASSSRTARSSA